MSFEINLSQQNNEETTKLKFITPIIENKWKDKMIMEYSFSDGQISIDENNNAHRGKKKKADYLLFHKENIPIAVVEAKGKDHSADEGYSQAVEYAYILDVPFAYATNGDDLIERDMITGKNRKLKINEFPTPEELWNRYIIETNMSTDEINDYVYPYFITQGGKRPRYYQRIAINRAIKAMSKGKKRLLIVMATGTGKTFTSFQIVYRFWKTKKAKKILFLADTNILVDQAMMKDFKPFADSMEKIQKKHINTSKEMFLGLYQQFKSGEIKHYKQLPRDFFDLIIIDECHRGSADEDSSWHEILEYFSSATQIGMTATPKDAGIENIIKAEKEAKENYKKAIDEKLDKKTTESFKSKYIKIANKRKDVEKKCNYMYFGEPIYTYSLKQGIEDGFLAPYKVVSVELNIDKYGWLPPVGTKDINGNEVKRKTYTQEEFDRTIISIDRRKTVAQKIYEYRKINNLENEKAIVFCESIEHAEETVRLLENLYPNEVKKDPRYITQITGDNEIGKAQLENFVDPNSKYPVIAVTSKLLSTGIDAETCKLIILDKSIGSMTEFKQTIGRGTRIKENYECDNEKHSKMFFTILDFRKNYLKFNDPKFDGNPVEVIEIPEEDIINIPTKIPNKPPISDIENPDENNKINKKIIKVNGIDVSVIGEDVQYLNKNGILIKEDIKACTKNYILSKYPTLKDFKNDWIISKNKSSFAYELLLEIDWKENFKNKYGYNVDDFDIICQIAYNIEPPISKYERIKSKSIMNFLNQQTDTKKQISKLLLNIYAETNFSNLKDIQNVFKMPEFSKLGYTPLKAIKEIFENKENYFEYLEELENKLYE